MKPILFAVSSLLLAAGVFSAAPVHAATAVRNYDCTKAGNVNKTVCKNAAAAKPAPAPKARNYDCSKPGNANKAVCKSATTPPTTVTTAPAATVTKTTRTYDCSKAGNANKAVCKGTATTIASGPQRTRHPARAGGANGPCSSGRPEHQPGRPKRRHGKVPRWYL
jgi:hypothetical protein